MSAKLNVDGFRYGSWTIQFRLSGANVECHCDCGTRKAVNLQSLRRGLSSSCGCQTGRMISESKVRHGNCKRTGASGTWKSWASMKDRCSRKTHHAYANYGGRGIAVCERWMSFNNFLQDMGVRPSGTSIDRINPNGNYEPSNCRWATRSMQSSNRRAYTHKK